MSLIFKKGTWQTQQCLLMPEYFICYCQQLLRMSCNVVNEWGCKLEEYCIYRYGVIVTDRLLKNKKPTWCHLLYLLYFLDTQHVSGINMSIFRSLRLCCWTVKLTVLFLDCCVLELGCGSARVVSGLPAEASATDIHVPSDRQQSSPSCNSRSSESTFLTESDNTRQTRNRTSDCSTVLRREGA